MSENLIVRDSDGIRWITLNRPERLNAFTWAMRDKILDALGPAPGVRGLVLTGTGRGFCAGVDVEAVLVGEADAPASARRANLVRTQGIMKLIAASQVPVVAAVNGVAAGGGWSLALACPVIVAAEGTRFVTAFTRLGLVPDLAGAYYLPRRVGASRAKAIILRNQALDAATALAVGAVDEVVPADLLLERAAELADGQAQG